MKDVNDMTTEEKIAIEYLKSRLYGNEDCEFINVAQEDLRIFLNLLEKTKKQIEELKEITKTYDSYIGEKMPLNSQIIIADGKYFMNGTFVNKFISKDKIRKLMNNYKELVEESEEKENKEWKNMNEAQKVVHNILKSRWKNYYNAYKELLGE